jgi:hypothetical protein
LNDHAFKIVATFELPSVGKRKTRKVLEPATWIEQATCGLRNSENPTSDNQKPQETTNQPDLDVGTDGPE